MIHALCSHGEGEYVWDGCGKRVKAAVKNHKLIDDFPQSRFVLASKIGDGFEIWPQLPYQPDHFQIATRLGLKTPIGAHAVQIAINVRLEQIACIIFRPARGFGQRPLKARRRKLKAVDKGLNKPNDVVRPDIIIHAGWQKSVCARDVPWKCLMHQDTISAACEEFSMRFQRRWVFT